MHSWVLDLSLCTSSALKAQRGPTFTPGSGQEKKKKSPVSAVLPQITRNKTILTQLEAVQALQCPWQCDGALAMSLMDKLALISAIKNRSSPAFTFFFMHFICMNNK